MAEPQRQIILTATETGFRVRVQPPVEGEDLDADVPTYGKARGWAGGLRLTRGWKIRDEVESRA